MVASITTQQGSLAATEAVAGRPFDGHTKVAVERRAQRQKPVQERGLLRPAIPILLLSCRR